MGDEAPSIRVETDFSQGNQQSGPAGSSGNSPNRAKLAIVGALIVLAVIVAAFVALRPETGTAADGSDRSVPTSSTTAPDIDDTEESNETNEALEAPGPLTAQVIENVGEIGEVVNAQVGYLAVNSQPAARAAPPIVRSIEGVAWTDVEAEVLESNDFDLQRSRFASFIGLRQTDEGFSVLRARQQLSEPGRTSTGRFIVDRLVSDQGVTWTVDPAFDTIITGQAFPFTTFSGDLALGVDGPFPVAASPVPGGFDFSIEQALTQLDCSPRGSSLDLLFIEDCDPVEEPTSCPAGYLEAVEAGTAPSDFLFIEPDGATSVYSAFGLLTAPQVIESATDADLVVAMAVPIPEPPVECALVDARPPGIFVWESPGLPLFVPISFPDELRVTTADLTQVAAVGSLDERLIIATPRLLLGLSADGALTALAPIDSLDVADWVPAVSSDGDGITMLDVRDGLLQRFDLSENLGGVSVSAELVAEQIGVGEVKFVDDELIVIDTTRGDRAIRLNPSS